MRTPLFPHFFLLFGVLLLVVTFLSCVNPDELIGPGDGKDTLKIMITDSKADTVRWYALKEVRSNGEIFDTLTMVRPQIISLDSLIEYAKYPLPILRYYPDRPGYGVKIDSNFIDNPLSQDTIILHNTVYPNRIYDTTYIPFTPDSAIRFVEKNGPQMTRVVEMDSAFEVAIHGYYTIAAIRGEHVFDDGTYAVLLGAPDWIELSSLATLNNGYDFYADSCCTVPIVTFQKDDGFARYPTVLLWPDSTVAESTYFFRVGLVNSYGVGDTLNFKTSVQKRP